MKVVCKAERMVFMLTARQLLILKYIIHFYTTIGEAVGSKFLAEQTDINTSSATIRNDMSVLEKNGFIQKTHFSSGRVPSIKGYRFYVDHLMEPRRLSGKQLRKISNALTYQVRQMDDIINQSAQVLSELTNYTAIVLEPKAQDNRLTGFRLVPLNENQIMAILQTNNNTVETMVFRSAEAVSTADIEKVSRIFNEHLVNYPLIDVYQKLQTDISFLVNKYTDNTSDLLLSIEEAVNKLQENHIYVSGKTNIFDFSENMEVERIKAIFDILDNEDDKLNSLTQYINKDINIQIGEENDQLVFNDLSLITANYHVANYGKGMIAILGPTSMPYSKTLGVMEAFRIELAKALLRYYLK